MKFLIVIIILISIVVVGVKFLFWLEKVEFFSFSFERTGYPEDGGVPVPQDFRRVFWSRKGLDDVKKDWEKRNQKFPIKTVDRISFGQYLKLKVHGY